MSRRISPMVLCCASLFAIPYLLSAADFRVKTSEIKADAPAATQPIWGDAVDGVRIGLLPPNWSIAPGRQITGLVRINRILDMTEKGAYVFHGTLKVGHKGGKDFEISTRYVGLSIVE